MEGCPVVNRRVEDFSGQAIPSTQIVKLLVGLAQTRRAP
jgi:hypothetical protein